MYETKSVENNRVIINGNSMELLVESECIERRTSIDLLIYKLLFC